MYDRSVVFDTLINVYIATNLENKDSCAGFLVCMHAGLILFKQIKKNNLDEIFHNLSKCYHNLGSDMYLTWFRVGHK